jgi:hypothetical protein
VHTKRKKIYTQKIKKSLGEKQTSAVGRELKRKSPGKQRRRRVEGSGRAAGSCPTQSTSDHCNRAGAFNFLSPKEDKKKKNLVRQKNKNMETRVCQTAI